MFFQELVKITQSGHTGRISRRETLGKLNKNLLDTLDIDDEDKCKESTEIFYWANDIKISTFKEQ